LLLWLGSSDRLRRRDVNFRRQLSAVLTENNSRGGQKHADYVIRFQHGRIYLFTIPRSNHFA